MIWPLGRRTAAEPSKAAVDSITEAQRELVEARALRVESQKVGSALRQAHAENHIAAGLERAIAGRKIA